MTGEGARSDVVQQRLAERGVASMVYYPVPLHLQPLYAALGGKPGDLRISERASREVLSIPLYPELTRAQIERVARNSRNSVRESLALAGLTALGHAQTIRHNVQIDFSRKITSGGNYGGAPAVEQEHHGKKERESRRQQSQNPEVQRALSGNAGLGSGRVAEGAALRVRAAR